MAEGVTLVTVTLFLINYSWIACIYDVLNEVGRIINLSKLVLPIDTRSALLVDSVFRSLLDHLAALPDKIETRSHLLCRRPLEL